jgi:hypothetical protein
MFTAADDIVVTLQGPRPLIPPTWWATHWGLVIASIAGAYLIILLIIRWRARGTPPASPLRTLESALQEASDIPAISRAVRTYIAAVDAELSLALSTEELAVKLGQKPIFLPARAPLLAVLRAADEVKFSTSTTDQTLVMAGAREAVQRIDVAQKLLTGGKKTR